MAVTLTCLAAVDVLSAQRLVETFGDGFDADLGWSGDLLAFSGEGGRLFLREQRADPSNTALVWLPAATRTSACWTLDYEHRFSPSGSNRFRWWLAADRPLAQENKTGFYFQFGGITGDGDALELYEVSAGTPILVAAGTVGGAAASPLAIRVEVCAEAGFWSWTATDAATGAGVDSARGTSAMSLAGSFAGFEVAFTSTRSGLLSVDDLSVGPVFRDTEAPRLVLAKADGPRQIILAASETLAPSAAEVDRYRVGGEIPSVARLAGDTVVLTLPQNLPSGAATEVTVASWVDLAGNESGPLRGTVTYMAPRRLATYAVLISEIMADPSPVIGLPEVEYIEVYNATTLPVDLAELTLKTARTEARLPAVTLAPGAYRAFARTATGDDRYAVFPELPTLTNSGATLQLLSGGTLVDEVTYRDSYYARGRADGGYSLERIDLSQPCALGAVNFTSSDALAGGTPSAANASAATLTLTPLALTTVALVDSATVRVGVNRALADATSLSFQVSDSRTYDAAPDEAVGSYLVTFERALVAGEVLGIALAGGARSCVGGESVGTDTLFVGIPELPSPGDWALNEIMYDPLAGQGRWVELVNRSSKLLSLKGLLLARANANGSVDEAFQLDREVLVGGGGYLVVAADAAALLEQFPLTRGSMVVESDVPTLGEDACLLLADPVTEERYFFVCYSGGWHNRAYATTDGVSLERIDLDHSAQDADNWTSASSTSGFGTPTLPNSQARATAGDDATELTLASERISPDGDGFEDLLTVNYSFGESGTLVRFTVVDLTGRAVYDQAQQTAPGKTGVWTWDGVDDDGEVVRVGTYVLRVEYFSPDSVAKRTYLPFSVVARQ